VKILTFALGLACASGLYAQKRAPKRFSWQNACFNNLSLPYCQGRDFGIKPIKGKNTPATGGASGNGSEIAEEDVNPSVIVMSSINWRFADPAADTVASIGFSKLAPSPLAVSVMNALGKEQGLDAAAVKKIVDAFSGVDQVALSMRGDQLLIMVSGCAPDSTLPPLENGWKMAQVQNTLLIGPAEAVDQARDRIAKDGPLPELASLAKARQANGDFWAASSVNAAGAEAVKAGLKSFSMKGSMRDRLSSDTAFEFSQKPDVNTIQDLPALGGASVDGNRVHFKMSLEGNEIAESMIPVATAPIGQYLGALVKAGRYIPARDAAQAKPKIAGLDPQN
jgi:hypothetical protein